MLGCGGIVCGCPLSATVNDLWILVSHPLAVQPAVASSELRIATVVRHRDNLKRSFVRLGIPRLGLTAAKAEGGVIG